LSKKCRLKHVTEGKIRGRIDVKERGGRRRKRIQNHLREEKGLWKLKVEAVDRNLWRRRVEEAMDLS
jgi:hypothetical protein